MNKVVESFIPEHGEMGNLIDGEECPLCSNGIIEEGICNNPNCRYGLKEVLVIVEGDIVKRISDILGEKKYIEINFHQNNYCAYRLYPKCISIEGPEGKENLRYDCYFDEDGIYRIEKVEPTCLFDTITREKRRGKHKHTLITHPELEFFGNQVLESLANSK